MKKIFNKWYLAFVAVIIVFITAIFVICGTNAIITIDNNLDLYVPLFKVMKDTKTFFSHRIYLPLYDMLLRDYLPSEFKLQTMLYYILPTFGAYVANIIAKIIISIISMILLGKELSGETFGKKVSLWVLLGLLYGLIPIVPYYGIAYSAVPLVIYLIIKAKRVNDIKSYLPFLIYPVLSDLRSLGVIILSGFFVFIIVDSIKNKKVLLRYILKFLLLLTGYGLVEYRFIQGAVKYAFSIKPIFIAPLSELSKNVSSIIFAIVGIVVVTAAAILISKAKEDEGAKDYKIANIAFAVSVLVLLFVPCKYNDVANTMFKNDASVSYEAYYASELIEHIADDIDYKDEWVYAYGIPNALLEYNEIRSVDGDVDISSDMIVESEKDEESFITDIDMLKDYGGRYIFSSIELEDPKGELELINKYTDENTPYAIYVYKTISRYMSKEISEVPFEERSIAYDYDEFNSDLDRLKEFVKDEEAVSNEAVRDLINKVFANEDIISSAYTIAEIDYYTNVLIEENEAKKNAIFEDALEYEDVVNSTLRELSNSVYYDVVEEVLGKDVAEDIKEYENLTDEQKDRMLKIQELKADYEQAMFDDYVYEYNGREWRFEDLYSEELMNEVSQEDLVNIYMGIYGVRAEVVGKIYLDLIELNNEAAKEEGYDNYMEYSYANGYIRDYTVEDAKKLFKEVKRGCTSYISKIDELKESYEEYNPGYITDDDRATYELLLPYIESVDSELSKSLEHLMRCNLFNLELLPTKSDIGFTASMEAYGDAYIFDSPYGQSLDFFTYIHEFGHYNSHYYIKEERLNDYSNMDVSEVQSQGLEMLMTYKYDDIFGGDTGKYMQLSEVASMADAVLNACKIAEFEIYAYEHPDSTVEELGKAYLKISESYGVYYIDGVEVLHEWTDVGHIFNTPGYYLAYGTSALGALQIYAIAADDYDLAVEKYMSASALKSYYPYRFAMEYVGLDDIFKKGVVKDILKKVYLTLNEQAS